MDCSAAVRLPCDLPCPIAANSPGSEHEALMPQTDLEGMTDLTLPARSDSVCCSVSRRRGMQAMAAAHWQAVQAAEAAAGVPVTQPDNRHSSAVGALVVRGLSHLPMWCPHLVDSAYLALIHQKLSCMPVVSRRASSRSLGFSPVSAGAGWLALLAPGEQQPAAGCPIGKQQPAREVLRVCE